VRPNDTGFHEEDYPFYSPCGKEKNFIIPADQPIVFHTLQCHDGGGRRREVLVYGGSLETPFIPSTVRLSPQSGRLYHYLKRRDGKEYYGLIRSQITLEISEHITFDDDEKGGLKGRLDWGGETYQLDPLPDRYEPQYGFLSP